MPHERIIKGYRLGLLCAILVAGLVLVAGCTTQEREPLAQSTADLAEALGSASPTFQVRHATGAAPRESTRHATDILLPNCSGTQPLERAYTEPVDEMREIIFDLDAMPEALLPYHAVMTSQVRETYRQADDYPPAVQDTVTLHAEAGMQQEHRLIWRETWDQNTLDVIIGDETVAEIPVSVLIGLELQSQARNASSFDGDTPLAEDRVPLIIVSPRPLETAPAATAPAETEAVPEIPCPGLTGNSSEEQLVSQYVDLLNENRHAEAYALLGQAYQTRLPYPVWQRGYEPVREIAICSLDALAAQGAGRATVYTTVRLIIEAQDQLQEELWTARFTVDTDSRTSSQRQAITSVQMFKANLSGD